jgi:hypothetical protein
MRHKNSANKKQDELAEQYRTWTASASALALREVYPAEEFAGFENFGESPEWHPGRAECAVSDDVPGPTAGRR